MTDEEKLKERRERAIKGIQRAVTLFDEVGIEAIVFGSLADGTFNMYSDVDILITKYPPELKYKIDRKIEDCIASFSVDVIYLDDLEEWQKNLFQERLLM